LPKTKNKFKKKTGFYRILHDHSGSRLTRWVEWFFPSQLQVRVLNETDPAKAPGHPGPGLTPQTESDNYAKHY